MYSTFKNELTLYLDNNWVATPIYDFNNRPGSAPKYDPWLGTFIPVLIDDGVQSMSEGAHCILSNYIIKIPVFVGSAEGVDQAVLLTEELKLLFIGKGLPGNITFYDTSTEFGVKDDSESSGSWYKSTLAITVEHRWFLN